MKSMLAMQSPHNSPWLPMRRRQAMQTGGKSRSASRPSMGRTMPRTLALGGRVAPNPSSASPGGISGMIGRKKPFLKVLTWTRV